MLHRHSKGHNLGNYRYMSHSSNSQKYWISAVLPEIRSRYNNVSLISPYLVLSSYPCITACTWSAADKSSIVCSAPSWIPALMLAFTPRPAIRLFLQCTEHLGPEYLIPSMNFEWKCSAACPFVSFPPPTPPWFHSLTGSIHLHWSWIHLVRSRLGTT